MSRNNGPRPWWSPTLLWDRIMFRWSLLTHRRCGALPPSKLPDARTCIARRDRCDGQWHADGYGHIWNDHLGRWHWMGPVVNLEAEYGVYQEPPGGQYALFTEDPER